MCQNLFESMTKFPSNENEMGNFECFVKTKSTINVLWADNSSKENTTNEMANKTKSLIEKVIDMSKFQLIITHTFLGY